MKRPYTGIIGVHGSDRNATAIAWCRANLGFARFETNALAPPLLHADATFDLVTAAGA